MEPNQGAPPVKGTKVVAVLDSGSPGQPVASFFRGLTPWQKPVDKAVYVLVFFACVFYVLCENGLFRFGRHPPFSCNDPLIQKSQLPEIVPMHILIPFVLIVPPLFLALLELRQTVELTVDRWFSAGQVLRRYFCGLVVVVVVVQVLKEAILEKRPHFLQSCLPVRDSNGTRACDGPQTDVLVTSYKCTARKSHNAFTSFPSGHACTATYCSLFVVGYLQRRAGAVVKSLRMRLALVFLWSALGTFVSGSRIWDHMHHWWDVVVGAAMGAVCALAALTWPQPV